MTTDRPTHAGGEGLPAEPALDPAPGFGLHQWPRQQIDRRGCTGNIAPARIRTRNAEGKIERPRNPCRINTGCFAPGSENLRHIAPPHRNFRGRRMRILVVVQGERFGVGGERACRTNRPGCAQGRQGIVGCLRNLSHGIFWPLRVHRLADAATRRIVEGFPRGLGTVECSEHEGDGVLAVGGDRACASCVEKIGIGVRTREEANIYLIGDRGTPIHQTFQRVFVFVVGVAHHFTLTGISKPALVCLMPRLPNNLRNGDGDIRERVWRAHRSIISRVSKKRAVIRYEVCPRCAERFLRTFFMTIVKNIIKVMMVVRKPIPRSHRLRLLVAMTRGLAPAGSMPLHSKAWYSTSEPQPARMNKPNPMIRKIAATIPMICTVFFIVITLSFRKRKAGVTW